jgi:general secretion pathway protein N
MKKRYVVILCASVVGAILLMKAPAAWLAPLLRYATHNAVDFSDSWGTVWSGSAKLVIRRSDKETLHIPQAIAWRLSVDSVLNQAATITLSSAALKAPVSITIKGNTMQVGAGQYHLPVDSLNTLGAPFNTLKPGGDVRLSWAVFNTALDSKTPPAVPLSIDIQSLRSGVTGAQVLGDYTVIATPIVPASPSLSPLTSTATNRWAVELQTVANAAAPASLLLTGSGELGVSSAPQFELKAQAATPQAQQRLQALLNFLGRKQGDVYVLRLD